MADEGVAGDGAGGGARMSSVPGFTQRQLVTVLGSLIVAVFLSTLDTTIVSTALPTIAGQFNAFESFAWVGTAYIVTATIAAPLLGKLSDIALVSVAQRYTGWQDSYKAASEKPSDVANQRRLQALRGAA